MTPEQKAFRVGYAWGCLAGMVALRLIHWILG